MLYFTGPNTLEWQPIRNRATKRRSSRRPRNPAAAIPMIPISASFTQRTSIDLRKRSASWPAVAEKRKNGRMKSAPLSGTSCVGAEPPQAAALVGDENHQRALQQIVVESAEELGPEEARRTSGAVVA